jgi:WD40 repeat protein
MSAEPIANDDPLTPLLVACDEALAIGDAASTTTHAAAAPPELRPRLERGLACLKLLHAVLPVRNLTADGDTPNYLGRFELRRHLGQGAFGVVWLAFDPDLRREVALKVPHAGSLADANLRQRFIREARAAAGLDHPGIVPTYEAGEAGPICYLASAYCPGPTLAAWLRQREAPVPVQQAARVVAALADAAQHAHSRGVIHRDLKPSNVLLAPPTQGTVSGDGESSVPRITDFGLAKFLVAEVGVSTAPLTHSGTIIGTPAYMAPEQAAGDPDLVGPAADTYALGVILYELLVGRPPFQAEIPLETLVLAKSEDPVPPSRLRPRLPRDLEAICLKCLRKEPGRRYTSAGELADELRRFLAGEPLRFTRPLGRVEKVWRWCRRNPWRAGATALAASALIGTAIVAVLYAGVQRDAKEQVDRALEKEKAERSRAERAAAESALAQGIVLGDQGDPVRAVLWLARALRHAANAGATDLEEAIRFNLAAWESRLFALEAIFSTSPFRSGIWMVFSPDDTRLALPIVNAVELWDWRACRRCWSLPHPQISSKAIFSSDSRRLAALDHRGGVHMCDVVTGRPLPPLRGAQLVNDLVFRENGDVLLTSGYDHALQAWSTSTGQLLDQPKSIPGRGEGFFTDGKLLLISEKHSLRVIDTVTGAVGPAISVSNAGREVVGGGFAALQTTRPADPFFGWLPVWAVRADGSAIFLAERASTRLWDAQTAKPIATLAGGGLVASAEFSPDGRYLVAVFTADGLFRCWDGQTGEPLSLLGRKRGPVNVIFSRDSQLAFRIDLDRVVGWDLAGAAPVVATAPHSGSIRSMALSASGRHLATRDVGEPSEVRVWSRIDAADKPTILAAQPGERLSARSPDGNLLVVKEANQSLRVWSLSDGQPAGPPIATGLLEYAAISADGRILLSAVSLGVEKVREVHFWDTASGKELGQPLTIDGTLLRIGCSPEGRWCYTVGEKFTRIWERSTRQQIGPPLPSDLGAYEAVGFSPDGSKFVTVENGRTVRLWEMPELGQSRSTTFSANVASVVFRRDGRYLLVGCRDSSTHLWDVLNWEECCAVHSPAVTHGCLFAPDGKSFMAPSWDRRLFHWRVPDGEPVAPPIEQSEPVSVATYIPSTPLIATAGAEHYVQLWHAPTARRVGPALHLERLPKRGIEPILWSDGQWLVANSRDGSLRNYPVPRPQVGSPDAIELRAKALTGMELTEDGTFRVLDRDTWQGCRQRVMAQGSNK